MPCRDSRNCIHTDYCDQVETTRVMSMPTARATGVPTAGPGRILVRSDDDLLPGEAGPKMGGK